MRRAMAIASAVVLLAGMVTALAYASHLSAGAPTRLLGVQAAQVDGNATCGQLMAGAFLVEHKFEPVASVTGRPLSYGGLSGALTIKVNKSAFDFTMSGDFVAAGVFVKAGDNGNLYDYRPRGGASADTYLHGPVNPNNGQFYGLSHVSFCLAEGRANLEIEKDPDAGEPGYAITAGDDAVFTIKVTNKGPATATAVSIVDTLPAGLVWTTTTAGCAVTGGNNLGCSAGDLAPAASFTVTVKASTTRADCRNLVNPGAVGDASNADPVSDEGVISVRCGAIRITKTAKHADTSGATSADLVATFSISGNGVTESLTTGAAGQACTDRLPLGTYSITETSVPAGYAAPAIADVTVDNVASCSDAVFAGESAGVENVPLTDVTVTVDSQRDGATRTVISCTDASGNTNSTTVSDGSLSVEDLQPTDPTVTLTCRITIDP